MRTARPLTVVEGGCCDQVPGGGGRGVLWPGPGGEGDVVTRSWGGGGVVTRSQVTTSLADPGGPRGPGPPPDPKFWGPKLTILGPYLIFC